jgi:hypothetical protein
MGMFDSFYDADGREWQTKAFDCNLDVWRIGDAFPADGSIAFQVEVIGDAQGSTFDGTYRTRDALVTVRDNLVAEVPAERDPTLPLIAYSGGLLEMGA